MFKFLSVFLPEIGRGKAVWRETNEVQGKRVN